MSWGGNIYIYIYYRRTYIMAHDNYNLVLKNLKKKVP